MHYIFQPTCEVNIFQELFYLCKCEYDTFLMKTFGIAAVAAALFSCCIMNAKEPAFKGTEWVFIEKIFVADAGTMTVTHTLKFTSDKEVEVGWQSYMPAHPQMYMNSDGSVDTVPASGNESVEKGTYVYKKGMLTITLEDGSVKEYKYQGGLLLAEGHTEGMVFSQKLQ